MLSVGPRRIYLCRFRMSIGPRNLLLPYPAAQALYPIPVRRVRLLLRASFPPCLTTAQLPLACGSAHHSPQGTYTPRAQHHARRTKNKAVSNRYVCELPTALIYQSGVRQIVLGPFR